MINIFLKLLTLSFMMCNCICSMDLKTPRNAYLSAFYKRSFAFHTVKNRMPIIVTNTIDGLVRSKEEIKKKFGEDALEELKFVIGELSKLKYEIQTNKPLTPLSSNSSSSDVQFYNNYISQQDSEDGRSSYFGTIWLLAECYMYRRIREIFESTKLLTNFDPFQKQKEDSYTNGSPLFIKLAEHLLNIFDKYQKPDKEVFTNLIKLNLWGNKCDLSLSNGVIDAEGNSTLFDVTQLEDKILCDHSSQIWDCVSSDSNTSDIICNYMFGLAIVLDNTGYEVFTDLCLADYLITYNLAKKIRFYVKTIPWFISDVMEKDFYWLIEQMKTNSTSQILITLGEKWLNYLDNRTWTVIGNEFWTLPYDFTYMSKLNKALYKELAESKLVIFKGDLNYRKLFGERNWDHTTSVDEALQGFNPAKLCTLRTIKADIVVGLKEGLAEEIESKDEKWMETGNYGLIQFSDKILSVD